MPVSPPQGASICSVRPQRLSRKPPTPLTSNSSGQTPCPAQAAPAQLPAGALALCHATPVRTEARVSWGFGGLCWEGLALRDMSQEAGEHPGALPGGGGVDGCPLCPV